MRKVSISLILLFLFLNVWSQPLPAKNSHTIIIDTDGAVDDMRAISYLLARPEVTVKAVITSDGSLPPDESAARVAALLNAFGSKNVIIGKGTTRKGINPPWRSFNRSINWAMEPGKAVTVNATDCLTDCLQNTDGKITLICLGSLSNIAKICETNRNLLAGADRIIWYNESVNPLKGFNFECDTEAAEAVLRSGVRVDVISNLRKEDGIFDTTFAALLKRPVTRLAEVMGYFYSQPAVIEKLNQNHFRLADDLVAIYLTNPELFSINVSPGRLYVRYNTDINMAAVREAMAEMISGEYFQEPNIVFSRFPADRKYFRYDIRPIIDTAIALYGQDEWKANVMTDEFHGHLGVFSIVGAKMGIRAREIFNAGPDMLQVVTYAGSKPPYSCLNDGIQVSTGATLGMGTIRLAADSIARPAADFTFRGRTFRISLKKDYLEKVDSDINEGIVKFGLMDDGYWKLIRSNAIRYWVEWDRNKIFDIEEVPSK